MITAKERVRPLSRWIATPLGLSLALLGPGCASLSGLRSVGTDRPSLLGFWNRPKEGSPAPGTDTYAQNMRAALPGAGKESNPEQKSAIARIEPDKSADTDAPSTLAAGDEPAGSSDEAAPASDRRRGSGIRVTLGAPEPLPPLTGVQPPAERLVSTAPSPSSWKAQPTLSESSIDSRANAMAEHEARAEAPAASLVETPRKEDASAILAQAESKLGALRTYQVRLTRVERVGGALQPEEEILLSVRRSPKAVRLEWTSGQNKGREVIYSSDLEPHNLFVHMGASGIPLPAVKIPLDSPLVMKNSRHSITEAGFETIVSNLRGHAQRTGNDARRSGKLDYKGLEVPPGLKQRSHKFVRRTVSGEVWTVFFDPRTMLPCLVMAEDAAGQLIERDVYRDLHADPAELASADAFEPEKRWGDAKRLLSRFARAATSSILPGANQTTTR